MPALGIFFFGARNYTVAGGAIYAHTAEYLVK